MTPPPLPLTSQQPRARPAKPVEVVEVGALPLQRGEVRAAGFDRIGCIGRIGQGRHTRHTERSWVSGNLTVCEVTFPVRHPTSGRRGQVGSDGGDERRNPALASARPGLSARSAAPAVPEPAWPKYRRARPGRIVMMGHTRVRTAVVASAALAATVLTGAVPAEARTPAAFSCMYGRVRNVIGLIEIDALGCTAVPRGRGFAAAREAKVLIIVPGVSPFVRLRYDCDSYDRHGDLLTGFGCQLTGVDPPLFDFDR